jgi:hypothetical protein
MISSNVESLDRGVIGTSKTIDKMHELVARAKLDPTIQKIAYWIRAQNGNVRGTSKAIADSVFWWVKRHGLFTPDPFQIEKIEDLLVSMQPMIEARQAKTYKGRALFTGDCDTYSLWVAALGGVLGFNYAFETVKVDRDRPDEYSHVYTALRVGDNWYPLDASTTSAIPGWRPPVAADLLRRWPEKPIEDVITPSGHGLGDDGDENEDVVPGGNWDDRRNDSPLRDVDAQYPQDSVDYGQPRDFGYGPGVVPEADFSDLHLLPPTDTQQSMASLEPDMEALQAAPLIDPSRRIEDIAGQPSDHGNPYYRNGRAQPYYKIERQPYPPGSQWNLDRGLDTTKFPPRGEYIQRQEPGTPERKVQIMMGQPMAIRRRHVTVMTQPQAVPYGVMNGMGDDDMPAPEQPSENPLDTAVFDLGPTPAAAPAYKPAGSNMVVAPTPVAKPATPAQAQAAQAGSSVWDAVSSVFKAVGSAAPAIMQTKAAQAVVNATNKVAGKNLMGVATVQPSFLSSPWTWFGAAVILGGGAYVAMKNKGGGRRRR